MWKSVLAVSLGAALGALLRWQWSMRWNDLLPTLPLGTLAANLAGGYLAGLAMGYFSTAPAIAPELRLLIITGFCGGLTTFSTFSLEVVNLLQDGQIAGAAGLVALHVLASLLCTTLGLGTWYFLAHAAH